MDYESEILKFLERDFTQCFGYLKHYDQQMWLVSKFTFTAYASLLGVSLGIYKYAADKNVDLTLAVTAALATGTFVGVFMFGLLVRNRVYFVTIARYINAHRQHFLSLDRSVAAFASGFYDNPEYPRYFNLLSTHAILSYVVGILNSILVLTVILLNFHSQKQIVVMAIGIPILVFLFHVIPASVYLWSREKKTAASAVFGDKKRKKIIEHDS